VRVLEAEAPAAGASGAAAGLVNPLMGRKAKPVWRLHEALDAVSDLLDRANATDLFRADGLLRPTVEAKQVEWFKDAVAAYPDLALWLPEAAVQERFPDVQTAGGAMLIPQGGALDVSAYVRALLNAARRDGTRVETGARVTGWGDTPSGAFVTVAQDVATERIEARRVLLCLGQGYPGHPTLEALDLHGIKGQTVRIERPPSVSDALLPMSGRGYIVPEPDGTLVLGSSYDHDFTDLAPDPEQTAWIQEKTAKMLPGVDAMDPKEVRVGVRVKHTETNLPLVGRLPGHERVWVFTALGSKGLLTAPMLARELHGFFQAPEAIPVEVRVPE
jgi:glycine/D-amino acid oxidase-like deaminating enzyme